MIISMIVAHDPNLVIGLHGSLPWHIPEDLAHFKQRTTGHPVVMGRGVFEELGKKPLPRRRNIVLSRKKSYPNVETCKSREETLQTLQREEKIYIIGGEQIYTSFYSVSNRLEITEIHETYEGDTYFFEYRKHIGTIWKEVARTDGDRISFVDYERISAYTPGPDCYGSVV